MQSVLRVNATSLAVMLALAASGGYAAQSQSGGSAAGGKAEVMTTQVDHSKSMDALLRAAQRLRETIQARAQQPPGPKRAAALESARDALLLTQRAMLDLPPDVRVESVKVVEATEWPKAAARLEQASEKLREALQGMSKQPAGKGRTDAMAKARKALEETQQAMLTLPDFGPR